MTDSSVYVLKSLDAIKIGVAKSVKARVKELKVGNPHGIHILFHKKFLNPYIIEAKIHGHFKKNRITGEWFRIDPNEAIKIITLIPYDAGQKTKISKIINESLAFSTATKRMVSCELKTLEARMETLNRIRKSNQESLVSSEEIIRVLMWGGNAITAKGMRVFGLSWPPFEGWMDKAIGRTFSRSEFLNALPSDLMIEKPDKITCN